MTIILSIKPCYAEKIFSDLNKNHEEHGLDSELRLDNQRMRSFVRIEIKLGSGLRLSFDKKLISEGTVTILKENNAVTIKGFSDKQIAQMCD